MHVTAARVDLQVRPHPRAHLTMPTGPRRPTYFIDASAAREAAPSPHQTGTNMTARDFELKAPSDAMTMNAQSSKVDLPENAATPSLVLKI